MPQETHKKLIIDVSADISKIQESVDKVFKTLEGVGGAPTKSIEKLGNKFNAQVEVIKKLKQQLDQSEETDLSKNTKLNNELNSLLQIAQSIVTKFAEIQLPPGAVKGLQEITAELDRTNKQITSIYQKMRRRKQSFIEGGGDLKESVKDTIVQSQPEVGSSGYIFRNQQIKTYDELRQAVEKVKISGAQNGEEEKELIAIYEQVNRVIAERIQEFKVLGQQYEQLKKHRADLKEQQKNLPEVQTEDSYKQSMEIAAGGLSTINDIRDKNSDIIKSNTEQLDKHTKSQDKNTKSVTKSIGAFIKYNLIINTFKRVLRSTIQTVTQMDEAMTGMAVVTSMNRQETWKLLGTWQDLASQTGKTTSEIASMATKFYQQGRSTSEVISLTEAAAKAATIAGIDGSRSIDLLTNAINGFQLSASQAMEVSDKFAALAATAATDYEELATALSKVAAQANLAGMSMDFTLGLLTKGIETTREAPETIGTALKTVVSRMRELSDYGKTLDDNVDVNRVAKALSNVGIELMDQEGQFRDLESVLTEVGNKWDTLTTNQQANIAVAMAGTRFDETMASAWAA